MAMSSAAATQEAEGSARGLRSKTACVIPGLWSPVLGCIAES